MAFFDFNSLKEKATDLAQSGVSKSKQMAEITKLKMANMSEEETIKKAYLEIGKLYYAEHGATTVEGAYASACEKITAAKAVIETNNDRITELKEESGIDEVIEDVKEAADDVKEAAADVAETVGEALEDLAEAAEELAEDIKEDLKD